MSSSEYSVLLMRIRQAGLLQPCRFYYAASISLNTAMLIFGWALFAALGRSSWQILVAIALAVISARTAFFAHDAGHYQIAKTHLSNYVLGLLHGNLAIGMAFGWWVLKHNRHHANPNYEGRDPDLVNKFIALTTSQAKNPHGLRRMTCRHQAQFFFPLMLFMAFAIHIHGAVALTRAHYKRRLLESLLYAAHLAAYLTVIFVVLPPWDGFMFIAIQQGLLGLHLGFVFAPNHKGMKTWGTDEKVGFLRRQVLSSRNVSGNFLIDFIFGGLNYQIEHHLFPSMPRANLRRAQPIIRSFCNECHIPYAETSVFGSLRQTMAYLGSLNIGMDSEILLEGHADR